MLRYVLVVDDEPIERHGVCSLLKSRYDVCVSEASSSMQALQILHAEPIEIIITDIRMPKMDGIELISEVRKLKPQILIYIYSAYGYFEYAQKAIKAHVSGYILKPMRKEAFYEEFDTVLERTDASTKSTFDIVSKAKEYIEQEYANDISLDDIANAAYVTPNYLCYLFKIKTGTTPIKYLNTYRLKCSAAMIENTDKPIKDIMIECGFGSSSYFTTIFKQEYGCTPTDYRNLAGK